jgi:hypothetical protein
MSGVRQQRQTVCPPAADKLDQTIPARQSEREFKPVSVMVVISRHDSQSFGEG